MSTLGGGNEPARLSAWTSSPIAAGGLGMSRGKWKPRRANGSVLEAFRHGRYNARDQLGHFVKPESQADHPAESISA